MGDVKLNSSGGGSVTLTTPSTASNLTVTLPSASGTMSTTAGTETLTNKTLTAAGSNTVEATSGPTSSQLAGQRNKIINGAMMIDQRNAGAAITVSSASPYSLDRWIAAAAQSSKYTVQQNAGSITPPVGFSSYLGATSLSSYSLLSTDFFGLIQRIEGYNCADLAWGTANAKTVTLSFWVRSSLTGTFGGSISGNTYFYPFSYTISSANTWTNVSITIAGPTSGTWSTDNSASIVVVFSLGYGSTYSGTAGVWTSSPVYSATGATSVVGTNGATFYITGVQLEKGATATPFENRLYGAELALCQRYFQRNLGAASNEGLPVQLVGGYTFPATWYKWVVYPLPVQMRASPTVTWYPNNNSTSEPGKARYYNTNVGGSGNNLTPYGFDTCAQYLLLKVYNEHNAFTCYGVGAAYDASAEL